MTLELPASSRLANHANTAHVAFYLRIGRNSTMITLLEKVLFDNKQTPLDKNRGVARKKQAMPEG